MNYQVPRSNQGPELLLTSSPPDSLVKGIFATLDFRITLTALYSVKDVH